MEAIKTIQIVKNGQVLLNLPEKFWGQQVEITITTASNQEYPGAQKKSMRGCLKKYANPSNFSKEKDAWSDAVKEKYGDY